MPNDQQFSQFDDPNAIQQTIVESLKVLGMPEMTGAVKVRQAYGEQILQLFHRMTDLLLQRRGLTILQPLRFPVEEDVQQGQQGMSVWNGSTASGVDGEEDIEDMVPLDADDEDDGAGGFGNDVMETMLSPANLISPAQQSNIIQLPTTSNEALMKVDANQWKLEVERVTPMLKVTLGNDNKDWRVHWQQLQHYSNALKESTGGVDSQLDRLNKEIEGQLEKISSREKYINQHFEEQNDVYKGLRNQLNQLNQNYNDVNVRVADYTQELARISEQLEQLQTQMDDLGSDMTNPKPLVMIRQALANLRVETEDLELSNAIMQHTLLQHKLKEKTEIVAGISPGYLVR